MGDITTVNEFYEDRYIDIVNRYLSDGYTLQSSSCQPNADSETVWCAILLKKLETTDE